LTRWIYRHADAIAVYGEHVKRYLVGQGVEADKIFVAAHAIDNALYNCPVSEEDKASLRNRLNLRDRKIVLYLGRLEEVKGLSYLIRAFARLNFDGAILVFAGDGSLRKELTQVARKQGIEENIRFAGFVTPREALNYYSIADVFVLPSITTPAGKETWGLVLNEAMNQGLPVVATDAVGAAAGGLVQSGVNGFVVPERDSESLAQAIDRILSDDKLREQMSANARRIVAGWNNERMVEGFRQAIEFAVRRGGAVQTNIMGAPARD
jgi:glycosyltransferase involved in cell wall biosynthesis